MTIRVYTEDELRALYLAYVRTNIPDADTSDFGDYDLTARVLAAVGAGSQAHALSLARQRFARECDDSELEAHGASRGLYYLAPTKASGFVIIAGNVGDVLPAGETITHPAGTYVLTTDCTVAAAVFTTATIAEGSTEGRLILSDTTGIVAGSVIGVGLLTICLVKAVPAPGIVDLVSPLVGIPFVGQIVFGVTAGVASVEAETAGASMNEANIRTVTIDNPVGGINPQGYLVLAAGGADQETPAEFRRRIVDLEAGRAASTNREAIRTLARAFTEARIDECFVYPNFGYPGRTHVVLYGAAFARELATTTTDEVRAFLQSAIGDEVDLSASPISYDGTPADVDVRVTPGTGFEPDWGSVAVGSFTVALGSTQTRVELTTSPVGTIAIGNRVLVQCVVGAERRTEQRMVIGVDAAGLDLDAPLSANATTGGIVSSGSPLAPGVIDAVEKMFDALGPGTYVTVATKDRIRWPNPASTGIAVVNGVRVLSTIAGVDGVLNVEFASAFTDRVPAALQTIRRGVITVRYAYV